jgi:hypothetical protein
MNEKQIRADEREKFAERLKHRFEYFEAYSGMRIYKIIDDEAKK